MKLEDLQKEVKNNEELIVNKSLKWVAITNAEGEYRKTKRVFKIQEDGELVEVPYKKLKQKLVKAIMKKIDVDKLTQLVLAESLDLTLPHSLFDLVERVLEKEGTVKQRPGCVELEIGGKKGPHLHFRIM